MGGGDRIYQLKVMLPYIAPPIWRRVEVPGPMTFARLHNVIQMSMGWQNYHLWAFYIGDTEIGPTPNEEFAFPGTAPPRPAGKTTLDEVMGGQRMKFRYVYDMGDDWLHEIKVEKVLAAEPGVRYPRCTGGARACPPEDCGGFGGYHHFLEAMANPKHPEHNELLEWIGGQWDSEAFDLNTVNATLQPRERKSARAPKKSG